jgi:hypothetical protein
MTVKRLGMLGMSVRKMKTLTANMETGTLIGKGVQNLTCFCIKCIILIVQYVLLADVLFLGGHLRFG